MTGRPELDRCPGLVRPFLADDGALVRVRVPGGGIGTRVLAELLAVAAEHGAPVLQLTSRANLQLRALPHPLPPRLVARLEDTGLFPSASHELVRNVIASPLDRGLRALAAELDAALVRDPELAELPGRFLWVLARAGDAVLGAPWDLAYEAVQDNHGRVHAGRSAVEVPRGEAVPTLLERARLFLRHRDGVRVWSVRDLPADSPVFAGMTPCTPRVAPPPPHGAVGADLVAVVPLGLLEAGHVEALAAVAGRVSLTPWRSLVIDDGAAHADALAAAGLVTTPRSAWARLSACVGAPACRRTSARTVELARAAVSALAPTGPRLHVVGCERCCGRPATDHVTVLSPSSVDDVLTAPGAHP